MKKIKLGNYFAKGVKIGALATAVLINNGCDELTQLCDDQVEAPQEEQIVDPEQYIFIRHRFAAENAKITSNDSNEAKEAWSNKHFKLATDYMREKVADFRNKVDNLEPANNFLQPVCQDRFVDFRDPNTNIVHDPYDYSNDLHLVFDKVIPIAAAQYNKITGAVAAKGRTIDQNKLYPYFDNREVFTTALCLLKLRAYNESAGYLHHSDTLPGNKIKDNIINNAVVAGVLRVSGGANWWEDVDYNAAESALNDYLIHASERTGVSLETLQDAVNLSILEAGMRGVNDLAKSAGFQLSKYGLQYPTLTNTLKDDMYSVNFYVSQQVNLDIRELLTAQKEEQAQKDL